MRSERRTRGRSGRRGHDHEPHEDRRGRMRHGDVKAALLLALQAGPTHGYELGHRLELASAGAWRPSPGSIYPTLQTLADLELVSSEERDGKRIYALTRKGKAELDGRAERGEPAPWQDAYEGKAGELREAVVGLKQAAKQLGVVGTPEQCTRATAIVVEARRRLYELLAQG